MRVLRSLGLACCLLAVLGCTGQPQPPIATTPDQPAPAAPVATAPPPPTGTAAGAVPEVLVINAANPGLETDIKAALVPGQIVVVDFYSEGCPPCRRIAPLLEQLAAKRADLIVRKVDINRAGTGGIDWQSPVVKQYGLDSVPHFKIFGADGQLLKEGDPAYEQIITWLKEAGLA